MRLAVGTTSVLSQVQGESTENYAINSFINTIHVLKKIDMDMECKNNKLIQY